MGNFNAPFRFDYVGSFLRPVHLKQARADFEAGQITKAELESIENEAITDLIKKQKAAGYPVITDGEFRRSYWHLDFMWGLEGIEHIELDHGYFFHGEETTHGSVRVTGKISGEQHPFVEHFKFVKQFEDEHTIARQTIPAPAQLLAELFREDNGTQTLAVYPDLEELIQDIAQAYRTVIRDLYDAGCRNIQFDDCTWGMFCDKNYWEARQKDSVSLEEEAEKYLRLNNLALENAPEDLVITTHVCRGNYHSTWASSGGYEPIAPFLFAAFFYSWLYHGVLLWFKTDTDTCRFTADRADCQDLICFLPVPLRDTKRTSCGHFHRSCGNCIRRTVFYLLFCQRTSKEPI